MAGIEAGGSALTIRIDGYQRDSAENDFDANWLGISVEVRSRDRSWSATAPALLTWEARELVSWLRSVAGGTDEGRGFSGMEGTLQFEAVDMDGNLVLTAVFWRDLAPEGVKEAEVPVAFPISTEQLTRFAGELLEAIQPYPIRVVEPAGYASKLLAEDG